MVDAQRASGGDQATLLDASAGELFGDVAFIKPVVGGIYSLLARFTLFQRLLFSFNQLSKCGKQITLNEYLAC